MRPRFLSLLLCCFVTAPASAADVTRSVPSNAYGYVVVTDASDLDAKIQSLGQRLKLPIPSPMAILAAKPQFAAALNTDGTVLVAFLPSENGVSPVVFAPVKDYAALVAQLADVSVSGEISEGTLQGQKVVVAKQQEHAVFAKAVDRAALEAVLAYQGGSGEGGSEGSVVQPDGPYDIAVVLTSNGLVKVTELAHGALGEAKRVLKQQGGDDNPALAGLEMYDSLFGYAREELNAVTVAMRIEEDRSLKFTKSLWAKPNSKLTPFLKGISGTEQDLLTGLPDIPFVVAMGFSLSDASFRKWMDLSKLMMGSMQQMYKMTPEQLDRMMELSTKYFKDFRGMSFLFGVGHGDDPLYSETVAAMTVGDAEKFIDSYSDYWKEFQELFQEGEASLFSEAKVEEIKLLGKRVLKVKMPIPAMSNPGGQNQAQVDALMGKLFGSNPMTLYLGAVDEHTVLMSYVSPDLLLKVWDSARPVGDLSDEPNLIQTRNRLPDDPVMVGFWSLEGTMEFAERVMGMMPATNGIPVPQLRESPPVGLAVRGQDEKIEFHMLVPIEAMEAVGESVSALMNRGNQPRN